MASCFWQRKAMMEMCEGNVLATARGKETEKETWVQTSERGEGEKGDGNSKRERKKKDALKAIPKTAFTKEGKVPCSNNKREYEVTSKSLEG